MIKTRFAPSPTGRLHVGNVRTALFAYLYARHTGGKFVLRIEDTDLDRSLAEYTKILLNDLRWLGLEWDEGPDVGGPEPSYLQSERLSIYKDYAQRLIDEGFAYNCYCTTEEIEASKQKAIAAGKPPHYDGKCKNLTEAQKKQYRDEGRTPVVRFIADDADYVFEDLVKGEVKFPRGMVGDFVIMRSNGVPVYNYAVVIDDALMGITHVLRADEHLSNTVRQLMIYKAHRFEIPKFAHMALVLGKDREKLSKRHGATSIEEYREMGYLPESILNYLALLGWSSPDGKEQFGKEEMIRLFDIGRLSPSPAVFDTMKLDWIAKHHIINADLDRIFELSIPYFKQTGYIDDEYLAKPENRKFLMGIVELTRGYCSHLSQMKDHVDYFLHDDFEITEEAKKFIEKDESKNLIKVFLEIVRKETRTIDEPIFSKIVDTLQQTTGLKGKNLFMPLRAALTGRTQGPEIYFLMPVIGNERTAKRLERALNLG